MSIKSGDKWVMTNIMSDHIPTVIRELSSDRVWNRSIFHPRDQSTQRICRNWPIPSPAMIDAWGIEQAVEIVPIRASTAWR